MSTPCTVDLLLRYVDAGETYVAWRWLDTPTIPYADVVSPEHSAAVMARLDRSLPTAVDGETEEQTLHRTLVAGELVNLDQEQRLCRQLAQTVLPVGLRSQLRRRIRDGENIRIRVTPSPRLSRVPWELLAEDEYRLIEHAIIQYDPPSTLYAHRGRNPLDWPDVSELPALHIVDPQLPASTAGLHQLLTVAGTAAFEKHLGAYPDDKIIGVDEFSGPCVRPTIDRRQLAELLDTTRLARLFYFGHVTANPGNPGSAAIHLSDTMSTSWGWAAPMGDGDRIEPDSQHRPFSARDMLLGTAGAPEHGLAQWRHQQGRAGYEIWKMPNRVAVIACEGGADYRAIEPFGLVMAMLNAGAETVTTTRWALPTDHAFHRAHPGLNRTTVLPTTDLALAVDLAHNDPDPITRMRAWQLQCLTRWKASGDIAVAPVVWASLMTTHAPNRTSPAAAPPETLI
ncbi:hypothetical protein GCM10011610_00970 [Nocardia rhizosphaerihabitans]|uniref:CHAT domain-containing protein n=2 Tax=Nocardia rhizosphaerihabitans TaxID=1691570 RepID=A0ABQ2K2M2_9NOCA|nr:hypothetical protein GCM10011610_00970 [Nocardia rhizosphaerihabitans]